MTRTVRARVVARGSTRTVEFVKPLPEDLIVINVQVRVDDKVHSYTVTHDKQAWLEATDAERIIIVAEVGAKLTEYVAPKGWVDDA